VNKFGFYVDSFGPFMISTGPIDHDKP